jgi:hypothetical protein
MGDGLLRASYKIIYTKKWRNNKLELPIATKGSASPVNKRLTSGLQGRHKRLHGRRSYRNCIEEMS